MRYKPDIKWSRKSLVYNLFRGYEKMFGRKRGIKIEAQATSDKYTDGRQEVTYKFYTWESLIVHTEQQIIIAVKNWFKHKVPVRVRVRQLATPNLGGYNPMSPHFMFAIAFDNAVGNDDDTTTTHTLSYTVTGADPAITPGIMGATAGEAGDDLTGWTYDGAAVTTAQKHDDATYRWCYLGYKAAPSVTANDLVATWTGSHFNRFNVSSYSGTHQSNLLDSSAKDFSASSADETISTTVVAVNCWLVAHFVTDAGGSTLTAVTGTLRGTAAEAQIVDSGGVVGTGSQSLNCTITSAQWNNAIMSIAPAAASFTPTINIY